MNWKLIKEFRIVFATLIAIPVFLMLDSPLGDAWFGQGQWVATGIVGVVFLFGLRHFNRRTRDIMLIGMVVGFCGEILFSLILGMYHYRLDNIPIWVIFGHGMIFAFAYRVIRKPSIRQYEIPIQLTLLIFTISFSLFWLITQNDWFGFLGTLLFVVILTQTKSSRTFFLFMYLVVLYIELVGTATQCWWWPPTFLGIEYLPSSANPPSGIAVFYFIFDIAVFWLYFHVFYPKKLHRYRRFTLFKNAKLKNP